MIRPTPWTIDQFRADAKRSRDAFRTERLDEPLEQYTEFFDQFTGVFATLVDELNAFANAHDPEVLPRIVQDEARKTALRYIAAPPISEDDLKLLADAKLSASALRRDVEGAKRVRDILLHILDQHRFPWVKEQRTPSDQEREIAIVSSAAMVAAKKVETKRRGNATEAQERAVMTMLGEIGYEEAPVAKNGIRLLDDGPAPGRYCGEVMLGATRADVVIRLRDRRIIAIECKATNSEVNSFKRLIHEALGKAVKWTGKFGTDPIIPCAVLSGNFSIGNLVAAQDAGLSIFWSHRLDDLAAFILAAK